MRIVVAVDWSDQAFAAVQAVTHLYSPTALTLVHAVDLGVFEHPAVAQAMALQGYDDFRRAMCDAGRQLLDQTSALLPPNGPAVRRVCEIGSPAHVILDTARSAAADLVVVGARGRGRTAELVLGSVSHRVLTHTTCSALVVKGSLGALRRVLLAVEGPDDAGRLETWLRAHPFNKPVEVSVISVAPTPHYGDPAVIPAIQLWGDASLRVSRELVEGVVARLNGPGYTATGRALQGDPAEVIGQEAAGFDLVVVGSHARKGVSRFLLGSVSHSVSHKVACPILVIR